MSRYLMVLNDGGTVPVVERMSFGDNALDTEGTLVISGVSGGGAVAGTPASATATGTKGTVKYDDEYLYVCVETNTWVRIPLSTW
jgi:hypothetical protein